MKIIIIFFLVIIIVSSVKAQEVTISPTVDLVSRYVWRGQDIASTPNIQPSIGLTFQNMTLGVWGAYTLSNQASASDEIDFWLSFNLALSNILLTPIITDYYYPNAGRRFFNFEDGTGAHLLEAGLKLSAENFPLTIAGYYNFYNEPGNNAYFELNYTTTINEIQVEPFIGAAGGSKENSLFYNTENFNVINIGIKATKSIDVSDEINLPVFVSFIVNPKIEKGFIVAGITF
jgi:hypothetical protein